MTNSVINKYRQDIEYQWLSDASIIYWNDDNKLEHLREVAGNNFMQDADAVAVFNGDYVNEQNYPPVYFIKLLMHAYLNFDAYSCRVSFSGAIDETTRARCINHLSLKFYMLDLLVRFPSACKYFLEHKKKMYSYIDSLHAAFAANIPVYTASQQYSEMMHIIGYCIDKHRLLLDSFALPYKDIHIQIFNRSEELESDELMKIREEILKEVFPIAMKRYLDDIAKNRDILAGAAASNNLKLFIQSIDIKSYAEVLRLGLSDETLKIDKKGLLEGIVSDMYKLENMLSLKFLRARTVNDRYTLCIYNIYLKLALTDFICSCFPIASLVLSAQGALMDCADFEFHSYRSNKIIVTPTVLINEISFLLNQLISYHCNMHDIVGSRYTK